MAPPSALALTDAKRARKANSTYLAIIMLMRWIARRSMRRSKERFKNFLWAAEPSSPASSAWVQIDGVGTFRSPTWDAQPGTPSNRSAYGDIGRTHQVHMGAGDRIEAFHDLCKGRRRVRVSCGSRTDGTPATAPSFPVHRRAIARLRLPDRPRELKRCMMHDV